MQKRTVAVLLLIPLVYFALWSPQPMRYGLDTPETRQPNTISEMRASAAAVDDTLDDGGVTYQVFAEYYVLSNHTSPYSPRTYHLVSRQHGRMEGFNQTSYHDTVRERVIEDLPGGDVPCEAEDGTISFNFDHEHRAKAARMYLMEMVRQDSFLNAEARARSDRGDAFGCTATR